MRSTIVHDLPGGKSHLLQQLLLTFTQSAADGFYLHVKGETVLTFMAVKCIVGNERALKAIFHFKGSAGRSPCGLCMRASFCEPAHGYCHSRL